MTTSQQAIDSLKREMEQEGRELKELESKLDRAEREVGDLEQKLGKAKGECDAIKSKINAININRTHKEGELRQMQEELAEALKTVTKKTP